MENRDGLHFEGPTCARVWRTQNTITKEREERRCAAGGEIRAAVIGGPGLSIIRRLRKCDSQAGSGALAILHIRLRLGEQTFSREQDIKLLPRSQRGNISGSRLHYRASSGGRKS